MFQPRYTITDRLLANIKRIYALVAQLNNRQFPDIVLAEFERVAREVSTHTSTSIEGNPLPLTEVRKILKSKPSHIRDSEKEVLNYNQILKDLNKKLDPGHIRLSLNFILKIQKQVTAGLLPTWDSGYWRKRPVMVVNPVTNQALYLPPDAKDVQLLMQDLVAFANRSRKTIDPLILAGIFHKQLVIIHPFMDGNGRTTRLATKVLLAAMGLDTFNLFSFEKYYHKNVSRYFGTVGELGNYYELADKIDFGPWLEYFTEGIIDELTRVQQLLSAAAVTPQTQLLPHHLRILEFIGKQGLIADRDYAQLTDRAKATRAIDFNQLIAGGVIARKGKGRATYYY